MIKIFIQKAAIFDFAILAKKSGPVGKSFCLDVVFEGKINQKGMVIDFSRAKKIVRTIMDDLDHKLLVSKTQIKYQMNAHIIVMACAKSAMPAKNDACKTKNFFAMHADRHWIKIIPPRILKSLENNVTTEFEDLIAKSILKSCPKKSQKSLCSIKRES